MLKSSKALGQILIAKKLITDLQLQTALSEQKRSKDLLGTILVRMGFVKERDLLKAVAEQFGVSFIDLKSTYIDWELAKGFTPSLISEHKCLPIHKDESSITMAIVNPLDVWVLQKAQEEARAVRVKFVLVSQADMEDALKRYRQFMRQNITDLFK